jgi:quinol monooxygenase YgiN
MHNLSATVFRVDKFIVPAPVLSTFVDQMQQIQRTLRTLPGCLRATVLTQTGGTGEFNALTLVEWENDDAVAAAQQTVQKKFAEEGFDPKGFVQRLGVRSDLGLYKSA